MRNLFNNVTKCSIIAHFQSNWGNLASIFRIVWPRSMQCSLFPWYFQETSCILVRRVELLNSVRCTMTCLGAIWLFSANSCTIAINLKILEARKGACFCWLIFILTQRIRPCDQKKNFIVSKYWCRQYQIVLWNFIIMLVSFQNYTAYYAGRKMNTKKYIFKAHVSDFKKKH